MKVNEETLRALERAISKENEKLMRFAVRPGLNTAKAWDKARSKRNTILNNCVVQFFSKETPCQ